MSLNLKNKKKINQGKYIFIFNKFYSKVYRLQNISKINQVDYKCTDGTKYTSFKETEH